MSDDPLIVRYDESLPESTDEVALLGGKAVSLRRIARLGLPVPPSLTLTTTACQHYFADPNIWNSEFRSLIHDRVQWLKKKTPDWLEQHQNSPRFAVRSGAPVSMPGMMKTFLNCGASIKTAQTLKDWTGLESLLTTLVRNKNHEIVPAISIHEVSAKTRCLSLIQQWESLTHRTWPDDETGVLLEAITGVFESWQSAHAQEYRQQHQLYDETGTAVTIQLMISAELSGVLFTCDPNQPEKQETLIEAVIGLGDQLVGGELTPFSWRVSDSATSRHHSQKFLDQFSSADQKLINQFADEYLVKLYQQAQSLREDWDCELDIEWAFAHGTIVFLQARPIHVEVSRTSDLEAQARVLNDIRQLSQDRNRIWARHNLSESLPQPTPLTWSLVSQLMSPAGAFGELYHKLGFSPSSKVSENGFLDLIGGQIYADTDLIGELFCNGFPFSFDQQKLTQDPGLIEQAPDYFDPASADPWLLFRLPQIVFCLIRAKWRYQKLLHTAADEFDQVTSPQLLEYLEQESQCHLDLLSIEELFRRLESRINRTHEFFPKLLLAGTIGASVFHQFQKLLNSLLGVKTGHTLSEAILELLPDSLLKRQQELLSQFSLSEEAQNQFLQEFGHRGPQEMELSTPGGVKHRQRFLH